MSFWDHLNSIQDEQILEGLAQLLVRIVRYIQFFVFLLYGLLIALIYRLFRGNRN